MSVIKRVGYLSSPLLRDVVKYQKWVAHLVQWETTYCYSDQM